MNILFISGELIGADLARRLMEEGANVKLYIDNIELRNCFDGIINKTLDWRVEIDWVGKEGLIIFDDVGFGKDIDKLRLDGYRVIGAGQEGERLELDRVHGQHILKKYGVVSDEFETISLSIKDAIDFVIKHPDEWVVKQNDHNTALNYIGSLADASDVIAVMNSYRNIFGDDCSISLQKRVRGVEIAIGRFFNGNDWASPSVINFEHKHLCNDDIGPLGGETGTLMWYENNEKNKLYTQTLEKIKPHLIEIGYKGYIDLNCIVNENKIYPLEFTCRFGSSTIETQVEIHNSRWSDFMLNLASGEKFKLEYSEGYAVNVAITVPPFPYRTTDKSIINDNAVIFFKNDVLNGNSKHIHFEGVKKYKDNYLTSGNLGYVFYITSINRDIELSRKYIYQIIDNILISKMFYRTDIATRFIRKDSELLKKWGWI